MDAKELRIGNYIHLTKDDFKTFHVYQMEGYDIYSVDETDCFDIKPIPLTEEWLLKFGWGFSDEGEYCDNQSIKGVDLLCDINVNRLEISLDKDEFSVRIEFVHSLQNLYFALTGKELEG